MTMKSISVFIRLAFLFVLAAGGTTLARDATATGACTQPGFSPTPFSSVNTNPLTETCVDWVYYASAGPGAGLLAQDTSSGTSYTYAFEATSLNNVAILGVATAGTTSLPNVTAAIVGAGGGTTGIYGISELSGVYGVSTQSGGALYASGVYGTGVTYGVAGSTTNGAAAVVGQDSAGGIGVAGSSSSYYGVSGTSTSSIGVYGSSLGGDGGHFLTSAGDFTGAFGSNTASSGTGAGVAGIDASSSGYGVYGQNTASSGNAYGGYFTSAGDYGVYGTGGTYGVYGATSGGFAVVGADSSTGTGVLGTSSSSNGVAGGSTSGYGVYGVSYSSIGVIGVTDSASAPGSGEIGVYGAAGGANVGVEGVSSTGIAVMGLSDGASAGSGTFGVYGGSTGGNGVRGYTTHSGSAAIYGETDATASSTNYGVYGLVSTPGEGVAIYGDNNDSSHGSNSWAGVFNGDVNITDTNSIWYKGTSGTCIGGHCLSDRRLKENIAPLTGALDQVVKLKGVTFEWKDDGTHVRPKGTQTGFIAQDVERVLPSWVEEDGEGWKGIVLPPMHIAALEVEAIKTLNQKIEADEAKIEAQDERINAQEERISRLEDVIRKLGL